MVRVGYERVGENNSHMNEAKLKNNDDFIEWIHRQLDKDPITIYFIDEQE